VGGAHRGHKFYVLNGVCCSKVGISPVRLCRFYALYELIQKSVYNINFMHHIDMYCYKTSIVHCSAMYMHRYKILIINTAMSLLKSYLRSPVIFQGVLHCLQLPRNTSILIILQARQGLLPADNLFRSKPSITKITLDL
jgi:hypothetical protein